MQKPSIGRIVHYQSYGTPGGEYLPEPRAAIITEVIDAGVDYVSELPPIVRVTVFTPTGTHINACKLVEEPTPGCVNWPPRV